MVAFFAKALLSLCVAEPTDAQEENNSFFSKLKLHVLKDLACGQLIKYVIEKVKMSSSMILVLLKKSMFDISERTLLLENRHIRH